MTTTTAAGIGCAILFGDRKARAMQELIEGATGEPCPCRVGLGCPLLAMQWRDDTLDESKVA